jgi:GNAT superfamily N-acetyltransferase
MNSDSEIQVRLATIAQIIDLRWQTLRAGLPREMADFPGDEEPQTRHVAAIDGLGKVVGCASFMQRPWQDRPAWQLRGMAVAERLQGRGIGARMLAFAEQVLATDGYSNQLWCNARTPATRFYERQGWKRVGDEFVVETAGPHYKMIKSLQGS